MRDLNFHIAAKILLYWYIFIFFSTEILSYFHLLERKYILLGELFFWSTLLFKYRKEILQKLKKIIFRSKSILLIIALFVLTFIQGFFSAPSTTDSMVYHLPRIMYWMQEKTLYQDVIRNPHDFMAPFAEYILLHLYFIAGSDRLLFFSQWISYVVIVILSYVIAGNLGADKKLRTMTALLIATLPIVLLQASSTQVDMIVAVLIAISSYLSLLLSDKVTVKNSILFALALGLGISTKATFYPFMIIPIGMLLTISIKQHWRKFVTIFLTGLITLIMPFRFMAQNVKLYGNILGPLEENGGLTLTNDSIDLVTLISNLLRNIMLHLPVPFFTSQAQSFLEHIHNLLGISISAPETTCCDFQFRVVPILYPQEDIIVNPLHLLLILISLFLFLKKPIIKNTKLVSLYILALLSFTLFALVLKWQPFHSRLQISFFIIGTISSALILSKFKNGLYILKAMILLSISLGIFLILLNVSRPFISYNLFNKYIKSFILPLSIIPQSFFIKSREEQYFNARYYWYIPYKDIVNELSNQKVSSVHTITFDLPDGFEYPLWVLLKQEGISIKVIAKEDSQVPQYLIKSSTSEETVEGFNLIKCEKTIIDYGYLCLYNHQN